jgi:hypothetical protein
LNGIQEDEHCKVNLPLTKQVFLSFSTPLISLLSWKCVATFSIATLTHRESQYPLNWIGLLHGIAFALTAEIFQEGKACAQKLALETAEKIRGEV